MTIALDPSQISAVESSVDRRVSIINGGAGTGKTTIIKEIIREISRENYALAAFAGKAAARLREATGEESGTIHRMLGYNGTGFRTGSLADISVIIDEASMVSADLMYEITSRRPKRLILVGDQAQLPPVGRGQPFHDLIKLFPGHVSTLTTCYRNREAIFQAAQEIRSGMVPWRNIQTDQERFSVIGAQTGRDAQTIILDMVRRGEIDFDRDIILCPRNGESSDDYGTVASLNSEIKAALNPNAPGRENHKFEVGDRVINTKNFASYDVWNGTTGRIAAIDSGENIFVDLDIPRRDGENLVSDVKFSRSEQMTRELELAYALTVHKSQGSQYRKVIFVALDRDAYTLLDRSLIYTAVTRAREHCIIIGTYSAFRNGIGKQNEKITAMQEYAHQRGNVA